jgi:hypothetical protein
MYVDMYLSDISGHSQMRELIPFIHRFRPHNRLRIKLVRNVE